MQAQEPDYTSQWNDLRRRIATFFICWVGGFIAIGFLGMLVGNRAVYLFPLWAIAFFVSGSRLNLFRCPRCSKHFFKPNDWSNNPFLSKCPHCGLLKWAKHDEERAGVRLIERSGKIP